MSERELPAPVPIEKARRRRTSRRGAQHWDIDAVAYHLRSEAQAVVDPSFGEGKRLLIGLDEAPVLSLELYPERLAARLRSRGMVLELTALQPPRPPAEEVPTDYESVLLVGEQQNGELRVGISAQGDVSLSIAPNQALEAEPSPLTLIGSTEAPPESPAESGEQKRVAIVGRVGSEPTFRTTPKGVLVAHFPLAEHDDGDTKWHRIVVFGDRAEALREALQKGQEVQVVGYVHQRTVKGRDQQERLVEDIYAAVINQQSK